MAIINLGSIDADYYERVLRTLKNGVELWHSELVEYATLAKDAIDLALEACRPGANMANALNAPSTTLRGATEKLAIDATRFLEHPDSTSGGAATLGRRIEKLAKAVESYRTRPGVSRDVYNGKLRGDELVNTLKHINSLIGGAPHFTNSNSAGNPLPIKPASFSDFITAFDNFQRALEDVYASTQTVSAIRLKDSAGLAQSSIYAQDGAKTLRNKEAELLKAMLDRDHADILGTAHMLEQLGHLNTPRPSHDTFAARLFLPRAGTATEGDCVRLEEALASDAPVILIQGEGGCGKTVALWRFGQRTNTESQREDISLYAKLDPSFPSPTLRNQISAAALYASDSRRVYVLLDGLDEVRSRRSSVVIAIGDLIATYPMLFWRISTRELGEDLPEEARTWHLFKMDLFGVDSIVAGVTRLDQISQAMRDRAARLVKSDKPLASLLGTAFYYTLFCWKLLELSPHGVDEPGQVFRSDLLKFALDRYVQRELERITSTPTPQVIDGWIADWKKAVLNELLAVGDQSLVSDHIANPANKHELFRDWLLACCLSEARPGDVPSALTKIPGPRRRSVMSLMLEVLLIADRFTALTETMFRIDPLLAAAGFVRRNPINAKLKTEYFFKKDLAATLLKDELDESPWLKAALSALMCGPGDNATNEAIEEIASQRVPSVPVSMQQTLNESAFWLLLDVQDAVYGHPRCAARLAKHVFENPEPWAELARNGYAHWIHYRQSLATLSQVNQVARGAPVLDTSPVEGERQAVDMLPAPLQARYWLALAEQIDDREDVEVRAGLNVTWLAQHCRELSLRLIHRLIVKRLIPNTSGAQRDVEALIEYAKQTPLLLPELFNILPKAQVHAVLKDQRVLDLFIRQVTPTAAAQFFRHVKLNNGPYDAERQSWRDRIVRSLRENCWCKKADPAEMHRLWEVGAIEPLPEAKKDRWQQSMRMRDANLLKQVGVQLDCSRECVEVWIHQGPSSEECFYSLDCKAITPANSIDGQAKPTLTKVVEELDECAILTLLERTGAAAPAPEIRDALEREAERRFAEAIQLGFDPANSQHNWCAILRIYHGKLGVEDLPERWSSMISLRMKAALLRHDLVTIQDMQAAERGRHLNGDRLRSYTYVVSHRGDDHCWLMHPQAAPQPMYPKLRYSAASTGRYELFDIKVGDAVLLRAPGVLVGAWHVARTSASCTLSGRSNESRESGQETELPVHERLKHWIRRSLHPVYGERKCLDGETPFHHGYWAQEGATVEQFLIPTRLDPQRSPASLNQDLGKGWFVVKVSHEDTQKRFWKCQGPLMGKDAYLSSGSCIIGKEGRQPSLGDFLFAKVQVRMHFERSSDSDGYLQVAGPVVSGPFAYLLPESLVNDTTSAWWKSDSTT